MRVTIVYVEVKEKFISDFIIASEKNHTESIKETGNLRFDILQSEEDPSQFVLYEAYASDEDATQHKRTAHYLQWRETVADWMANPRNGIKYNGLKP